ELRAADAGENPAHALEDGLAVQIFREFLQGMVTVAVAFDGQAANVSFDDQVNPKRPDAPLRSDAIASRNKALHDFTLEYRLGAFFLLLQSAHEPRGVLGMLDQLAAKVIGLEVVRGTERVDHPHLVAGAAGSDIEPLLEQFLVAEGKRPAFGSVHQRNKHHVALVSLKLSSVSTEQTVKFVAIRGKMASQQVVNLDGLLIPDQRDNAEAGGLTSVILPVFLLLDRSNQE